MAQFDSDIDLCMTCCVDYFGDEILYLPQDGGRYAMRGILDEAVTTIDTTGDVPVETAQPFLSVRLSEFDALGIGRPQQGDEFVIKGKIYQVTRSPEDGWSESRIPLFCEGTYNE